MVIFRRRVEIWVQNAKDAQPTVFVLIATMQTKDQQWRLARSAKAQRYTLSTEQRFVKTAAKYEARNERTRTRL
jgi:hypothetical protein